MAEEAMAETNPSSSAGVEGVLVADVQTPSSVRASIQSAVMASFAALEEVRNQIMDFDQMSTAAATAQDYLTTAMDTAKTRVEELRAVVAEIPVTELPVCL